MTVPVPSPDGSAHTDSRASRRGARASLTVVLLATGEAPTLTAAIASLAPRCRALGAEIVVVSGKPPLPREVISTFPEVRWVRAPRDSASERLRDLGMAAASGDIVALREDDAVGDGRWIDAFLRIVGGDAAVLAPDVPASHLENGDYHDRQADRARYVDGVRARPHGALPDLGSRPSPDGARGPRTARDR